MSAATAAAEAPAAVSAGLHITINRAEFLRALGFAAAIVERRNTIPVLANVLLVADGDGLRVTSTDLNLQIAIRAECQVEAEGSTTVAAGKLHDIIREFDNGSQIEMKMVGDHMQVASGRSRYKLKTIRSDDFPVFVPSGGHTFSLPAADMLKAIGKVAYAQDSDAVVRPAYCGVNIETKDGQVFFVATDGKRIAWSSLPAPEGADVDSAILSTKLVNTLSKLLDGHEGDVELTFETGKIIVGLGDTILAGKLVEGKYPPWRRILPDGDGKRLKIDAAALEAAVRRVALIASERSRVIKLELANDKLTISAESPEHGVAIEEAPCAWDEGDIALGFNSRFLLDTIYAVASEHLIIDYFPAPNPVARFTNPDDASGQWLLAPMYV